MSNLDDLKKQINKNGTGDGTGGGIGEDFINTVANNDFDLCDAIEESPIKEKESISIKIDVELLDKLRGLAQIKNKTVLELIELTIENATKNVETKYPNYKEEAEIYKKRFEKRRGPRAKKATTKPKKNK